ncbi:MAG: nitroreductase family protein [Saccharofermentanales bacterium]
MTDLQAIEIRKSRRSYLQTPLSQAHIDKLSTCINSINAISGLDIELIEDGSRAFKGLRRNYGLLDGVRSLITVKGPGSDVLLKEKSGYYGEMIVLEATKLGLGTCWVGGTYQKSSDVFKLSDQEELVCVITIGYVKEEPAIKERMIHGLTHRRTRSAAEFYKVDTTPPQWFMDGIAAVQRAPTAANSQKFRFSYIGGKLTAYVPDIEHLNLVDLGIGKYHFEIGAGSGRFALGNHGQFIEGKEIEIV